MLITKGTVYKRAPLRDVHHFVECWPWMSWPPSVLDKIPASKHEIYFELTACLILVTFSLCFFNYA